MKVRKEDIGMMAGAPCGRSLYVKETWIELYGSRPANATFCDRNGNQAAAKLHRAEAALMSYNALIRRERGSQPGP